MVKDKKTQKQRLEKARRDFKEHVRASKRKKDKNVRKQDKIKQKSLEEFKFQQHMARLLNQAPETRFS